MALVAYELPVEPLIEELMTYSWDSNRELVEIRPNQVLTILDRYLCNDLTAEQLNHWANLLESRDDVGFAPSHVELLKDVVFHLANPELGSQIDTDEIQKLRQEILTKCHRAG
jgi:hypothetical protein